MRLFVCKIIILESVTVIKDINKTIDSVFQMVSMFGGVLA